ncbi:MAG: hypothetical protein LBL35_08515 [Clostridiales bacterium]|jgi:hypothetical protein|nr:hypothetical protein [Clostridiales bacterium]
MKDIIESRLELISDLSERRALKKALFDVYKNLIDYNMDMYQRLEKRIYDEIPDPLDKYYIYCSMDYIGDIDPINDFLHPMAPSDLDENVYNLDDMMENVKNGQEVSLLNVFMKCDSTVIDEMLSKDREFNGIIRSNDDVIKIKVKLRRCDKYIKEIERLYKLFQRGDLTWNTVNCPYAYKFVEVALASQVEFQRGSTISEISVDLAEYEKYKIMNVAPLWNIKFITAQDRSFPIPAQDRINYEHVISLEDFGTQNGYIIDSQDDDYMYCKRLERDLAIISPRDGHHQWNLAQIEDVSNNTRQTFPFELISNKRELGFIGRYSSLKSVIIRTKAEISRILQTYGMSGELLFQDAQVLPYYDKKPETIDCNSFIDDNLRVESLKNFMLIKFRPINRDDYTLHDKMSFLVSELQILFPEYRCVGEFA